MTAALTHQPSEAIAPATTEAVLLGGDISRLSPKEKISYYFRVCESLGLNPLTQPFAFIKLQGKETFYAKKDCTEQLRSTRRVSVQIVSREVVEGCYVVTARASTPQGRSDESLGVVAIEGLKGELRSNAMMKAETKAKRRVTLSICGLGMLDESETDSIPGAQVIPLNLEAAPVPAAAPPPAAIPAAPVQAEVVDTGEAPPESKREEVRAAVRALAWNKAKARGFFTMHFGVSFEALTADQCEAALELLQAAAVDDSDASFEAAYVQLKAAGRVL